MLELTMGGRAIGGEDAVRFFEALWAEWTDYDHCCEDWEGR